MRLVDLNILLYVVNEDSAHHATLRNWWEEAMIDERPVGLSWMVLIGFLRLSTRSQIFDRPLTPAEAIERVSTWLHHGNTRVVVPSDRHWTILSALIEQSGTAGNLTNDAHLAALAIEYGATLISCDADFARFSRLRWENPLTAL